MKPELKAYYREDGSIECQEWWVNGKRHRKDGPARIFYHKDGSVDFESWWVDGRQLFKKDFDSLDMIKRMNAFPLFNAIEIARLKLDKPE